MIPPLIAQASTIALIWYAVPLILVISLVYGGTRHETLPQILQHAWRSAVWVLTFMGVIFAIVWLAGYGVAT